MKSVRLSELLRKQIMASVVAEFVANQLKDEGVSTLAGYREVIVGTATSLANDLWEEVYGSYAFSVVPEWALSASRVMQVFLQDDSSKVFNSKTTGVRPTKAKSADLILPQEGWDFWFSDYFKACANANRIEDEVRALRNEVVPILDSVGSTKQLLEIWPSMENFLPPHIADPDSGINLPALNISRLQEKIMGEKK